MEDMQKRTDNYMPDDEQFKKNLAGRQTRGKVWRAFYFFSILVAIAALIVLFTNVINSAFGSIATTFTINPEELAGGEGRTLADLDSDELTAILLEHVPNKMLVYVREYISQVPNDVFTSSTLSELKPSGDYPDGYADRTVDEIRELENTNDILAEFLKLNVSRGQLEILVEEDVAELQVVGAWNLWEAIAQYEPSAEVQARIDQELPQEIETLQAELSATETELENTRSELQALRSDGVSDNVDRINELNPQITELQDQTERLQTQIEDKEDALQDLIHSYVVTARDADTPDAELTRYHSWLDGKFFTNPMSSVPAQAGIRTALMGTIIMMMIVILVALPIGVGAAIYLEEYATDNIFNNLIETNVRNLAGVPSIIYGMLGLAIFVRAFAPVTSGIAFGINAAPPPNSQIISQIEGVEDVGIDIELDDNHQITRYTGPDFINQDLAQDIVNLFYRMGTPSLSNTGSVSLEETDQEIADLFGIKFVDAVPEGANADEYAEVAAGYIHLTESPLTQDQFESFAQQLRRIGSFTVNGRTILSAALTLALLILPVIIINSQEALRAVSSALREASYGLGATKWQTIWRTVLPSSIPGIMTGTILAVSRAIGETAPIIVVGASTFLLTDPNGPFSQFTVLPIQIYTWTSRPQGQFQFIAAAAIIVLLAIVLVLNGIAIVIRNRFDTRY